MAPDIASCVFVWKKWACENDGSSVWDKCGDQTLCLCIVEPYWKKSFKFSAKMNWKAKNFARSEPSFLLISHFCSGKHFFLNASPDLNWLHSPNSAPGRCWCWLASSIVLRSEPFVQIKIKIDENKCLGSSLFGSFLRGKRGREENRKEWGKNTQEEEK